MKCKELQVGDKIALINGIIATIIEVGEDYAYAVLNGYETMDPWEFNDQDNHPEGIPITSEILEKNGFNFGLTPLEEALSELDDFDDDFRENNEDTKVRPDAFFKEHWSYANEGVELNLYASDDLKKGNLSVDELRLKGHLEFTFQDCLCVHQLQHALRLCGLNELADDFQIQKDKSLNDKI